MISMIYPGRILFAHPTCVLPTVATRILSQSIAVPPEPGLLYPKPLTPVRTLTPPAVCGALCVAEHEQFDSGHAEGRAQKLPRLDSSITGPVQALGNSVGTAYDTDLSGPLRQIDAACLEARKVAVVAAATAQQHALCTLEGKMRTAENGRCADAEGTSRTLSYIACSRKMMRCL